MKFFATLALLATPRLFSLLAGETGEAGGKVPAAKGMEEASREGAGNDKPKAKPSKKPPSKKEVLPKVKLPETGEHEAAELFPLVEKLLGVSVALDRSVAPQKIEKILVLIIPELGGQRVASDELFLLLGASGIYFFEGVEKGEKVLIATINSAYSPEKQNPRLTRKFKIPSKDFEILKKELVSHAARKNRSLPPDESPLALAADPRTGIIIVKAGSEGALKGVEEIISRFMKKNEKIEDSTRSRLFTYEPLYRRAIDLEAELGEALSESQRKAVSIVVPRGTNVLMIRTTASLYQEIEEALKALDTPQKARKKIPIQGAKPGV